jgi:hypothetical protein
LGGIDDPKHAARMFGNEAIECFEPGRMYTSLAVCDDMDHDPFVCIEALFRDCLDLPVNLVRRPLTAVFIPE